MTTNPFDGFTPHLSEDERREFISAPKTDVGNAQRLTLCFSGRFLYCPAFGWLRWDRTRWVPDALGAVTEAAKHVTHALAAYVPPGDAEAAQELRRFGIKSQSKERINAMVTLSRTDPAFAVEASRFDTDPWLFNCQNGTIDLKTGRKQGHNPSDLITKMSPVDYKPELGTAGLFSDFMLQILPGDAVEYLLRVYGYGLVGVSTDQFLTILYGSGANGKSTLEEYVQWIMGDYALMANDGFFIEQKHKEHATEIARLVGKRLIVAVETGEGRKLNETRVKSITGGDRQAGRFMNKDFFEFEPTWTVTMATNHKPLIRGSDHAIWRRVRLVPFEQRFVDCAEDVQDREREHCKDPGLPQKLREGEESSKALNLLVEGCKRWQSRDLSIAPDLVLAATQGYQDEMDDAGRFIAVCCEKGVGESQSTPAVFLYKAYVLWAAQEDVSAMNSNMFGRKLTNMGFDTKRINVAGGQKVVIRLGLKLHNEWETEVTFADQTEGVAI